MDHDQVQGGVDRRAFLQRAAIVGGATLWAAPTVQSIVAPAFAVGTGLCPPGRLVRFKYEVKRKRFDSGAAAGGGANWCLPDGYDDADVAVDANGNFSVDGVMKTVSVSVSTDGKTATITIPSGARIEDLQAKAGNARYGECDDFDYQTGNRAVVVLEKKKISFVAGVLCV